MTDTTTTKKTSLPVVDKHKFWRITYWTTLSLFALYNLIMIILLATKSQAPIPTGSQTVQELTDYNITLQDIQNKNILTGIHAIYLVLTVFLMALYKYYVWAPISVAITISLIMLIPTYLRELYLYYTSSSKNIKIVNSTDINASSNEVNVDTKNKFMKNVCISNFVLLSIFAVAFTIVTLFVIIPDMKPSCMHQCEKIFSSTNQTELTQKIKDASVRTV